MGEKPTKPPEEENPGLIRRAAQKMKPTGGARQTIGVVLLLTVVAVVVAGLVLSVERSRANYFEQRKPSPWEFEACRVAPPRTR